MDIVFVKEIFQFHAAKEPGHFNICKKNRFAAVKEAYDKPLIYYELFMAKWDISNIVLVSGFTTDQHIKCKG